MRILTTVLLVAPLVCAANGSTPITTVVAFAADKNKEPATDDSIRDQVMMKLAADTDVKGGGIDVAVKDGAVTLKGAVDTDKARQKAEKLAKHVKGVRSVTNELTLRE
ncbi:MAG: BON domain-containing protein [Bryobacteraceae bacterium]|jgi:osmotically-inducible protein OsmY